MRAKNASFAEKRARIAGVRAGMARSEAIFLVNDDPDLAAETEDAGLHLGQDDGSPCEARRLLGGSRVIGLSTHSIEQAQRAIDLGDVIDYFCVGPVFPTATKPEYAAVGLELVAQVAARKPSLPWFAIGGITVANVGEVRRCGAERVVVVSDVLQASDPAAQVKRIRDILQTA